MNTNLRLMKFGGTSVGDAACIRRAADIVVRAASEGSVVAVVSAMGGVTNHLIEAAQASAVGDMNAAGCCCRSQPTNKTEQAASAAITHVMINVLRVIVSPDGFS